MVFDLRMYARPVYNSLVLLAFTMGIMCLVGLGEYGNIVKFRTKKCKDSSISVPYHPCTVFDHTKPTIILFRDLSHPILLKTALVGPDD